MRSSQWLIQAYSWMYIIQVKVVFDDTAETKGSERVAVISGAVLRRSISGRRLLLEHGGAGRSSDGLHIIQAGGQAMSRRMLASWGQAC